MGTLHPGDAPGRSGRAIVLCILVVLVLVGAVVLNRLRPQSDLSAVLFMLGLFLGLPLVTAELQPAKKGAATDGERGSCGPSCSREPLEASERTVPTEPSGVFLTELSYRYGPANISRMRISGACQWATGQRVRSFS